MSRKVAVVTGADRGIGRGIANRVAEAGYDIFMTFRTHKEKAEAVKKEIEENWSVQCYIYQADFVDAERTVSVIREAVYRYGRLDLLVNNAAIMPPRRYQYEYEVSELDDVIAVNYRGYMLTMRDAIRYWIKSGTKGNIVNISSESGIMPHQKFSLYGSLKAAICQSTKSVALDVAAYGIRVNAVVPGLIESKTEEEYKADGLDDREIQDIEHFKTIIPLRRGGYTREIGNAVVWLASDEAAYITGHSLVVDGGLTLTGMTNVYPDETEELYGCLTIKNLSEEDMKNW